MVWAGDKVYENASYCGAYLTGCPKLQWHLRKCFATGLERCSAEPPSLQLGGNWLLKAGERDLAMGVREAVGSSNQIIRAEYNWLHVPYISVDLFGQLAGPRSPVAELKCTCGIVHNQA